MGRTIIPLDQCGLFYFVGTQRVPMPLDGVHVSARIVNLVAEVQVVQFYVNPTHQMIDTKYTFPLDESAAVCGFEAELEDKLLIGEVREKQEARAEYNAAIARGETAALLEQDKPDVFTQLIGNVKPHSRVNIRITYVVDLKVESDDAVRFILPTSVAPRYTPYGPTVSPSFSPVQWRRNWRQVCLGRRVLFYQDYDSWCKRGTYVYEELPWYSWNYYTPEYIMTRDKPCAFSVTIEIEMPSAIVDIESPTHTLKWERGATVGTASASFWYDTEPMGKDLTLRVYQEKAHEPHAQVEIAPDGSGCAMVTMVPNFEMEPEPTEIVFLVDCSGSMSGTRIQAAVRALQVFLRALPMTCHFNIILFGSSHRSMFSGASQPYTEQTLQTASNYVANIRADLGGTEILKPLNEIFKRAVAGGCRKRQVFVLTDGQVSNTEQVIEACRRNAHNSRVFTVGIGDDVSRALVEGMARAATGTAQFILGSELTGSSGALEAKLINQLKLATQPSITKVLIDWGLLGSITPPTLAPPTQSPSTPTPTPVTHGTPVLVTFKVRCDQIDAGDAIFLTGDNPVLGQWNPMNALKMALITDHGYPIWAVTTSVNAGAHLLFKFLKKTMSGMMAFESFAENRETDVPLYSESVVDCGVFNVKSNGAISIGGLSQPLQPPVQQPLHTSSVHMGGGVMMTGPNTGSKPVSKFFQTGPGQKNPSSVHAVGSGPAVHSPSTLAPAVGAWNDASSAQSHARNAELYQAPFLPPPIFSNSKFVMYAFFAAGRIPTQSIRISAESPEGPMEIDVPITKLTSFGKTIHVLAARALIRDLDEGTSHLHWRKTNLPAAQRGGGDGTKSWFSGWLGNNNKPVGGAGQDRGSAWNLEPVTPPAHVVKAEMIDLGVRFGIVSSATSFVAVERWRDGRSGSSQVPLALPSQQVPTINNNNNNNNNIHNFPTLQMFGSTGGFGGGRGGFAGGIASGFGGNPLQQQQQQQQRSSNAIYSQAPVSRSVAPSSSSSSFSFAPTPTSAFSSAPAPPPAFSSAPAPPPAYPSAPGFSCVPQSVPAPSTPTSAFSSAFTPFSSSSSSMLSGSIMQEKKSSKKSAPVVSKRRAEKEEQRSFDLAMECDADEDFSEYNFGADFGSMDPVLPVTPKVPSGPPPTTLFMQQKFDGSFEINDTLATILHTSSSALKSGAVSAISKMGNVDTATAEKLWVTIYVLGILQKWYSSYESSWEMTADKAKQWCITILTKSLGDKTAARRRVDELIASV